MKTYEVHYSFLLDGAKVKMFHKTILSSVTHVAHPLVTPSLQTPYYGSKFPISGIIIFCTLRQTTRPANRQTDKPTDGQAHREATLPIIYRT